MSEEITAAAQAAFGAYHKGAAGADLIMPDSWDMQPAGVQADWLEAMQAGAKVLGALEAVPLPAEPAKVIIVTEENRERRYALPDFGQLRSGELVIGTKRDEDQIAVDVIYAPGQWKRAARDGAEVPDATARALGIARRALEAIARISDGNVAIKLATDALDEIFAETE